MKMNVKANLELHRVHKRKYPEITIGSKVKIYKKKDLKHKKERYSTWSDNVYEVEAITEFLGQKFYKVNNREYPRNELLLIQD